MRRQKGFTLIELLVVISIIALLLSILMPSLRRAKNQAKAVVCMSKLHQWGLAWSLYAQENDERYFGYDMFWGPLRPYYEVVEMLFCPMATRTPDDGGWYLGDPFSSWGYGNSYGSYGMNAYFHNPEIGIIGGHGGLANHWRSPHPKGVANIPLFLDANWVDGWPEPTDEPPEFDGQFDWGFSNNMRRYCVNRHSGSVNILFADYSARKTGLKQLWTSKWHRSYDTGYPPPVWPDWMRKFKD